jgi:hypothetical protein
MRLETSEEAVKTSPPPQPSPAQSGAGKAPSSPRGGKTNLGCTAPKSPNFRAEEDFISPPDFEDTGANNMGTGSEDGGRTEPMVPSVLKEEDHRYFPLQNCADNILAGKGCTCTSAASSTEPSPACARPRQRARW